jgi:hypothetical protein
MKKIFVCIAFVALAAGFAFGQTPSCQNDNALENRIDAVENQGWVEVSREFQPYYYFAVPETPFIIGELHVTFEPQCDPGEACPRILMLYSEKATATSPSACHWQRLNP